MLSLERLSLDGGRPYVTFMPAFLGSSSRLGEIALAIPAKPSRSVLAMVIKPDFKIPGSLLLISFSSSSVKTFPARYCSRTGRASLIPYRWQMWSTRRSRIGRPISPGRKCCIAKEMPCNAEGSFTSSPSFQYLSKSCFSNSSSWFTLLVVQCAYRFLSL